MNRNNLPIAPDLTKTTERFTATIPKFNKNGSYARARMRGVILSPIGWQRFQTAKQQAELEEIWGKTLYPRKFERSHSPFYQYPIPDFQARTRSRSSVVRISFPSLWAGINNSRFYIPYCVMGRVVKPAIKSPTGLG
jgi:hypothetical protein